MFCLQTSPHDVEGARIQVLRFTLIFDGCLLEALYGGTLLAVLAPARDLTVLNSNVLLGNGARLSLANSEVRIKSSRFTGNGTILAGIHGFALTTAEFGSNTFEGVHLVFNNIIRSTVQLRNNIGLSYKAELGLPKSCDSTKTGVAAGCDQRAECHEPSIGDVQCSCASPLSFKADAVPDGSRCELAGQLLDIFRQDRVLLVTLRKPESLYTNISVHAESEGSFSAVIETSTPFLSVDGRRSVTRFFTMSTAKSSLQYDFELAVLGQLANWSDSETQQAVVTVTSPESTPKRLTVNVMLEPYDDAMHACMYACIDAHASNVQVRLMPTHDSRG